jgi:hypothetical protein
LAKCHFACGLGLMQSCACAAPLNAHHAQHAPHDKP